MVLSQGHHSSLLTRSLLLATSRPDSRRGSWVVMPVGHLLLGQGGKRRQRKVEAIIRANQCHLCQPMPTHANHLLH